jgi:cyclohexanone monooxygenase
VTLPDYETVIVGAGFSGIGTAIKLDKVGLSDYFVIEAGDGPGGTWYWNTYPGIAVDIPSFSYQFSFEQSPNWSRTYAPGHELKAYAEHCVDKYDLRRKIRFNTKVLGADFDETQDLWHIRTDPGGVVTARFLVNASGALITPKLPDIDGVDSFAGVSMHTARWDHNQDLTGKRVAIIGTGASAVQVIPAIAPDVERLVVFQRTPIWCLPKPDAALPARLRWVLARVPGSDRAARVLSQAYVELSFTLAAHFDSVLHASRMGERIGRKHLREQVHDPVVRDKLTPRYAVGCKRPSFHNEYLAAFNRDNVHLDTSPIDRIDESGISTGEGHHDLDALILATGFKLFDSDNMPPYPVIGRGGTDLAEWWDENRLQAYEGTSVPGFPNLFTILGPYAFNGSSYFNLIEAQTRHITRCLVRARKDGATMVEVTREANDRYFAQMLARRPRQIFWQESCSLANSYYFDHHGDVPFRASPTLEVGWRSARFDLDDYRFAA